MAPPDPSQSGINVQKNQLTPQRQDASRQSSVLKRDGSENKLVDAK